MRRKVLIIKLGWSETLDAEISLTSSLGDVLRTTVILHEFRGDEVTWLVDAKARELIEGNRLIARILHYSPEAVNELLSESFDLVVNLEKVPELCALAHRLPARLRFGFGYDQATGTAISLDGCERVYSLCKSTEEKRNHREPWQKALLEIIGGKWQGQEYILGYAPKAEVKFDIGLNHVIGPKWPTKQWPKAHWEALAELLESSGYRVTWQEGLSSLNEYMEWIQSCRQIITCDSLGFHLALALRKKVVVMYGPTNSNETHLYGRGRSIWPADLSCAPCLSPVCSNPSRFCMGEILPDRVFQEAEALLTQEACESLPRSG